MFLPSLTHSNPTFPIKAVTTSCVSSSNPSPSFVSHPSPLPNKSHYPQLKENSFPYSLMFTSSVINVFSLSPLVLSIIKHWKAEHWICGSFLGTSATRKEGIGKKASVGTRNGRLLPTQLSDAAPATVTWLWFPLYHEFSMGKKELCTCSLEIRPMQILFGIK